MKGPIKRPGRPGKDEVRIRVVELETLAEGLAAIRRAIQRGNKVMGLIEPLEALKNLENQVRSWTVEERRGS